MPSRSRCVCATLFVSGLLLAAWLVMTYGVLGMLIAFPTLAIARMAADRADPTKWSGSRRPPV